MSVKSRQSIFLHGLESSSNGTKARFFAKQFPQVLTPDFQGNLQTRLDLLEIITQKLNQLVLVGSSFGGLMATAFTMDQPNKVNELILLAPALNFPEFTQNKSSIDVKTTIYQGQHDTICPHAEILAISKDLFTNLIFNTVDDDHMLHSTFRTIPWQNLLA